jgi:hypothetical protein
MKHHGLCPWVSIEVEFSFKVECPSEFDCKPVMNISPQTYAEPQIDYLAKDYDSFRRLLLDRLPIIMPDWKERNPADLGVVIVEAISYRTYAIQFKQIVV